eukprot:1311932-Pyramimonas_sp.AAC.1
MASGNIRTAASGHVGAPLARTVAPYELCRRRQSQSSHGGLGLFLHAPHTDRGPIKASPKAP